MSNCKECIKSDVCKYNDGVNLWCKGDCPKFIDLNRNLELPCKVGDTVYYITGIGHNLIKSAKVKEIIFDENGIKDLYVQSDNCYFGNSLDIFSLTYEEAEKVLKEKK